MDRRSFFTQHRLVFHRTRRIGQPLGRLHNHCNLTYGHGDMRNPFEAASLSNKAGSIGAASLIFSSLAQNPTAGSLIG